uniref:Coluporin-17 n=1 Tax=Colubraria reticulata TaxID=604273 RepID=A0A499RTV6_9CAEN|nr:coluporin-17 [Colubraria reticulata]
MKLQFSRLKTLLMIILFVIGHGPPPVWMLDFQWVKTHGSKSLTTGSSAARNIHSKLKAQGYLVTLAVLVENWTRYSLISPAVYAEHGVTYSAPTAIQPGTMEEFAMHKTAHAPYGTSGTASWEVPSLKQRFVVMWSVPYDHLIYSNWLALGMSKKGQSTEQKNKVWYRDMYESTSSMSLYFKRKKFRHDQNPITFRDDDVKIYAVMTNGRKCYVRISFLPVNDADLAPNVRQALKLS